MKKLTSEFQRPSPPHLFQSGIPTEEGETQWHVVGGCYGCTVLHSNDLAGYYSGVGWVLRIALIMVVLSLGIWMSPWDFLLG